MPEIIIHVHGALAHRLDRIDRKRCSQG